MTVHGDVVSHVNISKVSVQDGGLYECTASNRAGSVRHSARLNVYGKLFYWFDLHVNCKHLLSIFTLKLR